MEKKVPSVVEDSSEVRRCVTASWSLVSSDATGPHDSAFVGTSFDLARKRRARLRPIHVPVGAGGGAPLPSW